MDNSNFIYISRVDQNFLKCWYVLNVRDGHSLDSCQRAASDLVIHTQPLSSDFSQNVGKLAKSKRNHSRREYMLGKKGYWEEGLLDTESCKSFIS